MLSFFYSYVFNLMSLYCDFTCRMVECRRRTEREAFLHTRNTKLLNTFEYNNLVSKAFKEYTPKMFVQEQGYLMIICNRFVIIFILF